MSKISLEDDGSTKIQNEVSENNNAVINASPHEFSDESRPSTTVTAETSSSCDDVLSGVEKAERLLQAQVIGKLLIAVDPGNALRHGTYADILILKGMGGNFPQFGQTRSDHLLS